MRYQTIVLQKSILEFFFRRSCSCDRKIRPCILRSSKKFQDTFLTIYILISALLIFPLTLYAAIPTHFPDDLIYNKQPIDPLCFQENDPSVSLAKCSHHPTIIKTSINDALINQGYVGYNYRGTGAVKFGYSYYKAYGNPINNNYVIYAMYNTGGPEQFTALYFVSRAGDALNIQILTSGDRCNHGIMDVTVANNTLSYKANLTPFDFLIFTNQNPHNFKPEIDLAACATCCEAIAQYQRDLSKIETENLINITLGGGSNSEGKYQSCFNRLISTYKQNSKTVLTPGMLWAFAYLFNATCLKYP